MGMSLTETTKLWEKALKVIENKLNEKKTYDNFFAGSYIYEIRGSTIIVIATSLVAKTVMNAQYADLIASVVSDLSETDYVIKAYTEEEIASERSKNRSRNIQLEEPQQYFADSTIRADLTFDNFVVGSCNKEAYKAALYITENDKNLFNPLFIFSNPGLGKTHLLCAVANKLKERKPSAKVLYITAKNFVDEYLKFVRAEGSGQSLSDYFKTVDLLLLDDVQFLAEKVKTQEMFFYIYEDLIRRGSKVVLTSDRQPSELRGLEDRLVSRFKQGLTTEIHLIDKDTCVGIIKQKLIENGFDYDKVDPKVIDFFAESFSKDVRELEQAINRLTFHAKEIKEVEYITIDVAIDAMGSIKGGNDVASQLTEQKIINIVADYYGVTPAQLTSKVRTGQIALARHISMYLIRKHLDVPLKRIGEVFGGKDHTTVMSGINKVEKELKTDPQLQQAIEELESLINQ